MSHASFGVSLATGPKFPSEWKILQAIAQLITKQSIQITNHEANDVTVTLANCKRACHNKNSNQHVPVSQLDPLYPAAQQQVCESTPSMHVPPFWQGLGEQSSTSAGKRK
jgi:hypothetical protein